MFYLMNGILFQAGDAVFDWMSPEFGLQIHQIHVGRHNSETNISLEGHGPRSCHLPSILRVGAGQMLSGVMLANDGNLSLKASPLGLGSISAAPQGNTSVHLKCRALLLVLSPSHLNYIFFCSGLLVVLVCTHSLNTIIYFLVDASRYITYQIRLRYNVEQSSLQEARKKSFTTHHRNSIRS